MRWLYWVVLAPLLQSPAAAQASWFVDKCGCDGLGTGSRTDPFCTIQEGIDAAADGDTVLVRSGVYVEDLSVPGIRLTILGQQGAAPTQVRGMSSAALELAAGADLVLDGLWLSGPGGGLLAYEARLAIRRCRFLDPASGGGSAIVAELCDLVVSDSRFENRTAEFGGAIAATDSTLHVDGCLFEGAGAAASLVLQGGALWLERSAASVSGCAFRNLAVAYDGSGIWLRGGELVLEHCSFASNYVFNFAGTLAITDADARIRHCTFRDNVSSVGWGGAVYVNVGPSFEVEIADSIFERNQAAEGGAVCVRRGFVDLQRCTFSRNHAGASAYSEYGHGGGLFVGGFRPESGGGASARASRCVFAENAAHGHDQLNDGQGGGAFGPTLLINCTFFRNYADGSFGDGPTGGAASGGARLHDCIAWANRPDQLEVSALAEWSDVQGGWPGAGNFALDPGFWDREHGDFHLRPGSTCIDRGDPAQSDEDGSRLDVGAFAFDPGHGVFERRAAALARVGRAATAR